MQDTHWLGRGAYPCEEIQSVYSTAQSGQGFSAKNEVASLYAPLSWPCIRLDNHKIFKPTSYILIPSILAFKHWGRIWLVGWLVGFTICHPFFIT